MFQFLNNDWGTAAAFVTIIGLLLASAEYLLKKLEVAAEATRRIVHMLVGIMVAVAPFLFTSVVPVLAVAGIFTVLNFIAIQGHFLDGIHAAKRKSYGTVYFPISFALLSLWFWDRDPAIMITAMYIMALGDPVAGWVGESSSNRREYRVWKDVKSLQGSMAMFVVSYITVFTSMLIYRNIFGDPVNVLSHSIASLFVAAAAAVAESMSREGSDNLSVPLVSAFFMNILYNGSVSQQQHLMLWIGITTLVAVLVHLLRFLSLSGTLAAWLLGSVVFGIGGMEWILPLAFFFVSSSLLSKIGKKHKKLLEDIYEKGDRRDFYQVFANGGIALVTAVLHFFFPGTFWYLAYLSTLAAATADTWATELGTFSSREPRSILNLKPVPHGSSGAISLPGTAGAFLGALSIAAGGLYIYNSVSPGMTVRYAVITAALITLSGFAGSMIDSLAGATIQGQYRCPACGKITEKQVHCATHITEIIKGNRAVNNDAVNLLCTFSAVLLFSALYLFRGIF